MTLGDFLYMWVTHGLMMSVPVMVLWVAAWFFSFRHEKDDDENLRLMIVQVVLSPIIGFVMYGIALALVMALLSHPADRIIKRLTKAKEKEKVET